jgi:hypothetical protein
LIRDPVRRASPVTRKILLFNIFMYEAPIGF